MGDAEPRRGTLCSCPLHFPASGDAAAVGTGTFRLECALQRARETAGRLQSSSQEEGVLRARHDLEVLLTVFWVLEMQGFGVT